MRRLVLALASAIVAFVARPALAQEKTEDKTDPVAFAPIASPDRPQIERWQPPAELHVSGADWAIVGAGASVTLATAILSPQPKHVYGGVLFDESVRNALRATSQQRRYQIRDASDVGLSLTTTWPFLIDALVTAWWYRGNAKVAREMTTVDAEAIAVLAAVQGVTNVAVSRERPYGRLCGGSLPEDSLDCQGSTRYRSFFSGHSSTSFASAGLICMHHLRMHLIGGPYDLLSCIAGEAVAATTATFRVVADMHYASDVLTGALTGTLIGIGIPLLHYHTTPTKADAPHVSLVPVGTGLGLGGTF